MQSRHILSKEGQSLVESIEAGLMDVEHGRTIADEDLDTELENAWNRRLIKKEAVRGRTGRPWQKGFGLGRTEALSGDRNI